jgi:hypothetical protein
MAQKKRRRTAPQQDRRAAHEIPPDELVQRVRKIHAEYSSKMRADIHPWVEMPPTVDIDAVVEFDRATCARGITRYRRRLDPSEIEFAARSGHPGAYDRAEYIIVVEAAPGCRCRMGVHDEPRFHDQRKKP